jgi:capsular exopolysaccharide synthesis family protein
MNQNQSEPKENSGDYRILHKYLPYWPLFLTLFVITFITIGFYLKFATPLYSSTASLLLKDEKKGEENSKMEEALNLFGSKNIVENQIEIIKSYPVLQSAAEKLNLCSPVFVEKGWFGLGSSLAYSTSPVIIELQNQKEIIPVEKVKFKVSDTGSIVTINGKKYPLNQWVKTEWGVLRFVANPNYRKVTTPDNENPSLFFSLLSQADIVGDLSDKFKAVPSNKLNTVIKLSISDPVPQRGEEILREIVLGYYKSNIEKTNKVALNTLNFIEERLKSISGELESLENKIQRYRSNSGSIDMTTQSTLYLQRMEENDKQINTLNLQSSALDQLEKYVTSKGNEESIAPSIFSLSDPILTNLMGSLYVAEAKQDALKNTVAENNPILIAIKEDISKTRAKILENIRNQKENIGSNKLQLDRTSNKYSSMLNTIPVKEKELVEVSRDRNTKMDIYTYLLQKREEIAYSMNSNFEEANFVESPISTPGPVSPNRKIMYLLGLVLPFVTGLSLVYLKESVSGKILYRDEIEKLTRYPVIGQIIDDDPEVKLPTASNERSFINEQFRYIRNTFKNSYKHTKKIDKILVTSSLPGEGKSFFASNFAVSLAKTGKKVLLIELDLYRPKLGEYFNIKSEKGIIDYLSHAAMISEIILPVENVPNLSIILAGKPLENSSELLNSGKIDFLLKSLESSYDVIIIDSTPLRVVSDAMLIEPKCNMTIYMIRQSVTPKSIIEKLDSDMVAYNFKNVAIVFNGVKKRGFGKYSYGYGFGYGYDSKNSYHTYTSENGETPKKKRKITTDKLINGKGVRNEVKNSA